MMTSESMLSKRAVLSVTVLRKLFSFRVSCVSRFNMVFQARLSDEIALSVNTLLLK